METMKKDNDRPSLDASRRVLRASRPEDFDGHTGFRELDAEGRIRWASRAAELMQWGRDMHTAGSESPGHRP